MGNEMRREQFRLGLTLATPGALAAESQSGDSLGNLLKRHQCGDWGETCPEDTQMNEEAVGGGGRVFSAYSLRNGTRIWIITEADRTATTVLLPEEY